MKKNMSLVACSCFMPSSESEVRKWNQIIKKQMQMGDAKGAMLTYVNMQMLVGLCADNYTYPILLKAAGTCSCPRIGFALHAQTIKTGFVRHAFVQNALLNMYSTFHRINDASKVFDMVPVKDVVSWNSMLNAYTSNGRTEDALNLFNLMPLKDITSLNIMISGYSSSGMVVAARRILDEMPVKDVVSWNSMILGYTRAGELEMAAQLFRSMPVRNVVTWNSMITGCLQSQLFREVLRLFDEMKRENCVPDHLTVAGVLSACAHLGSLERGKQAHIYAIDNGFASSPHVTAALVDMYAKCGSIQYSLQVFYKASIKDIYCWNAVISALGLHGHGSAALKLFNHMRKNHIIADDITFICLLNACSHSGLVQEGCQLFSCMQKEFGISPKIEHYGCMVDLLARAEHIDCAYRLVDAMPFEPGEAILGALLSACVIHRDLETGERVMKMVFSMAPNLSDGEIMMFVNLYASCGRLEEANRWRKMMNATGMVKAAGCCIIEVNGVFHKFLAA
uniref:Pentatricopeptide repeat-containing protein n=1 Tax=Rhizophora mucronata TaxID=61149 RepID=A0A2P2IKK8_RHIMU